jgi:hypothetical protein
VDVGKPRSTSSTFSGATASVRVQIHMVVRADPDSRYVFQFGGELECGPVVDQVPGEPPAAGTGSRSSRAGSGPNRAQPGAKVGIAYLA